MTADEAVAAARAIGYPVILRPSYVLGGRGMVVVSDEAQLKDAGRNPASCSASPATIRC